MNYSKAVKGSSRRLTKLAKINSAAETELGRSLTPDEILALIDKYSHEHVVNYIEKVLTKNLIALINHFILSMDLDPLSFCFSSARDRN